MSARLQMCFADTEKIIQVLYLDKTTLACHFLPVFDVKMQVKLINSVKTLWRLANDKTNGWKANISTWTKGRPPVIVELAVNKSEMEQDYREAESQFAAMQTDLSMEDVVFLLALNDSSEPAKLAKLFKCFLGSVAYHAVRFITHGQSGYLQWILNNGPSEISWRIDQPGNKSVL